MPQRCPEASRRAWRGPPLVRGIRSAVADPDRRRGCKASTACSWSVAVAIGGTAGLLRRHATPSARSVFAVAVSRRGRDARAPSAHAMAKGAAHGVDAVTHFRPARHWSQRSQRRLQPQGRSLMRTLVRPLGRAAGSLLGLVLPVAQRHQFRLRHAQPRSCMTSCSSSTARCSASIRRSFRLVAKACVFDTLPARGDLGVPPPPRIAAWVQARSASAIRSGVAIGIEPSA